MHHHPGAGTGTCDTPCKKGWKLVQPPLPAPDAEDAKLFRERPLGLPIPAPDVPPDYVNR